MDFSKQYILMCEQSEELQDSWLPTYGDYVVSAQHCLRNKKSNPNLLIVQEYQYKDTFKKHTKKEEKLIYSFYSNGSRDVKYRCGKTWLPRQDQLQKMIDSKDINYILASLLNYMQVFQSTNWMVNKRGESFEQLWLSFIMFEKYSKIFDGTKWIKK